MAVEEQERDAPERLAAHTGVPAETFTATGYEFPDPTDLESIPLETR